MSETTPPPPGEEPGRTTPPPGPPPPPAPPPPSSEAWPSSPPPAPPPPAWSPAGPPSPADADANARQWAMLAHLSALAGLFVGGLIFLGPLLVYLVKKDEHPFIADQSREALNFNLSVFIYIIASAILIILVVGILLLPAVAIAWLILTIIAAVRANNGEPYRYPLTIRLVI